MSFRSEMLFLNSLTLCLICCVVISATQNCELENERWSSLVCREVSVLEDLSTISTKDIRKLSIWNTQTKLRIEAANSSLNLSNLLVLDLSHVANLELIDGGFSIFPQLIEINISGCGLDQLLDSHFANDSVLNAIDARYNKFTSLTKDLFNKFPHLVFAYFDHNALSHLELPHMQVLRELYLGHNKLTDFNFSDCSRLEKLYLNDNQLTQLYSTSFQQLPELLELQLSGNLITEIGEDTFQSLIKLRTLNLSRNALTSLPADVFSSSTEQQFTLQQMDLSHNNINVLFENQFELLGGLQLLNLSGNKIAVLKSAHFAGLTSLRNLHLQSNDKMELRGHTFATLKQLETLDLSHIGLDILGPHLFGYKQVGTEDASGYMSMAHMRILNLNGNKIQHLHTRSFARLPFLEELSLANNGLRLLPISLFASMQQLQKLNLSHNQLAEISSDILKTLNNITDLDIGYNQLTFLPNLNGTLPHLQSMTIEGNPWQCACLMEFKDWLRSSQVTSLQDGSDEKPLCVETALDYCDHNVTNDRRNDAMEELKFWQAIG